MRGLTNLMWVQFKLYLREPAAFFFTLAFPALCLLLFGAIYGNQPMPAFWGRPVGTVGSRWVANSSRFSRPSLSKSKSSAALPTPS